MERASAKASAWGLALAVAAAVLAACDAPQPAAHDAREPIAQAAPAPVEADTLQLHAEQALRAQRIHAPAGDNAVEHYLALRERDPQSRVAAAALAELQPYVLIATEQELARADVAEAQRLFALLERIDAQAPALPRLREAIAQAQRLAAANAAADAAASTRAANATIAAAGPAQAPVPVSAKPAFAAVQPPPGTASSASPVSTSVPPDAPPNVAVTAASPVPTIASSVPAPATAKPRTPPLPRLISDAAPRYPMTARNRRIEGSAVVAFTIRADGSVGNARVLTAQPTGVFDEAALAAAARWRFEATGRSVDSVRTVTFRLPPQQG